MSAPSPVTLRLAQPDDREILEALLSRVDNFDEEEQRVREAIAGYVRQFDPDVSAETCAWCTRIGERLPCDCPFRVCRACWANTLRCPNCRSLHGEDDDMMM